jgi:cyclophilin family peptidyl-prolyl cis-trans isomerase
MVVAIIVAINLLIAARSVISRMPHGDPNINVIKGDVGSRGRSKTTAAKKSSALQSGGDGTDTDTDGNKGGNEGLEDVALKADQHTETPVDLEAARLAALKANASLPLVYFDVEIKENPVGRIEMVLFPDVAPRAAENFRQLCTGESGRVPDEEGREGAGLARHFKGASFYRIIDQFIDQAGANVESVFGGQFEDDPGGLALKHEHKGILSMANMGPDTNTAHFSIMMGPQPHLDTHYTIFGQVVEGFDVVDAINALSKGKPDNTATADDGVAIANSGQLRKGKVKPNLKLGLKSNTSKSTS